MYLCRALAAVMFSSALLFVCLFRCLFYAGKSKSDMKYKDRKKV